MRARLRERTQNERVLVYFVKYDNRYRKYNFHNAGDGEREVGQARLEIEVTHAMLGEWMGEARSLFLIVYCSVLGNLS